jgi:hypothetical protein
MTDPTPDLDALADAALRHLAEFFVNGRPGQVIGLPPGHAAALFARGYAEACPVGGRPTLTPIGRTAVRRIVEAGPVSVTVRSPLGMELDVTLLPRLLAADPDGVPAADLPWDLLCPLTHHGLAEVDAATLLVRLTPSGRHLAEQIVRPASGPAP